MLLKGSFIFILQKEVRRVYKSLLEDDENFDGWTLGHGYVWMSLSASGILHVGLETHIFCC